MTLRRLDRILADRQVVALTAVGRPFDPRTMRAVATVEDQGRDHGVVVEEMRPGFLWGDDLLRPAEVVVNRLVVEKGAGT
jgi:molecular chaperone GrpE